MTSWVHLFSKFTSEALLFEAAFICFLFGSYIAYSVVRKRREGSAGEAVPSSVVKGYLNELITDAEQMRSQLFGLLESSGISPGSLGNHEAGKAALLASLQNQAGGKIEASGNHSPDSELLHKISALESRMKDQARAMELLVQEKVRIEGELSLARTKADHHPSDVSAGSPDMAPFQKKIAQLEAKLAEYSVIEDDLSNLKRLQQENAELKSRLSGTASAPEATQDATPENPPVADSVQAPSPSPETSGDFAQLAPQVEASLTESPITAEPAPTETAATTTSSPQKPSEADLLAEFEKMLNG